MTAPVVLLAAFEAVPETPGGKVELAYAVEVVEVEKVVGEVTGAELDVAVESFESVPVAEAWADVWVAVLLPPAVALKALAKEAAKLLISAVLGPSVPVTPVKVPWGPVIVVGREIPETKGGDDSGVKDGAISILLRAI